MNTREIAAEATRIAVSATPGAGGTAWTAADGQIMLSIAVGVMTLILVVLQIAHLIWRWHRGAGQGGGHAVTPGQKLALLFTALSLGAGGLVASEGWVLKGYPDPVHGARVPTACAGVTEGVVLGKVYTEDECVAMTAQAMLKHAAPIMPCMGDGFPPSGGRYLMTLADTSYNIGTAGFLKSSMCRQMKAGNYRAACNAIPLYKYAGGKDCTIRANNCRGVITRRAEQQAACLKALP